MLTKKTSAFYLPKPTDSIFSKIKTNEYPTIGMLYGYIEKQMGLHIRKHLASVYSDEQTFLTHYVKEYDIDDNCIKTGYTLPAHGWGRSNAIGSLSMSLFRRRTRHSVAKQNYIDLDMVSAQPKMFLELAILEGMAIDGLDEYCADPKAVRKQIVEHYKLQDKKEEDGTIKTAMEQAKKLPIRMAFGGGIARWKQEFVTRPVADMPLIKKMETTLKNIRKKILKENPHLKADLEEFGGDYYKSKSEDEKERTVMALYIQTWERIIQEHAIAFMVRKYDIALNDIIPSQDGFMPLKSVILEKNINITTLLSEMKEDVKKTYNMEIDWAIKGFDEAIEIGHSDVVPIKLTEEDLNLGETHIAKLMVTCLKNKLIYSNKRELWYYTNPRNVWMKSKKPDDYLIATTIQHYIKGLQDEIWKKMLNEKDEEKKKELKEKKKSVDKWHRIVGQSAYLTQVTKYLRTKLNDDTFAIKLDDMAGKIVFYDGIYDCKLGVFRKGIRKDDFVSVTLNRYYADTYDKDKMAFLKKVIKKITNNSDEHFEYGMCVYGYGFTGDADKEKSIYYFVDGTDAKKGDNGKTFWLGILEHFFPEYVRLMSSKFLEEANPNLHKQIPTLDGVRWLYLDEGTKKKPNAELLKKIGDGLFVDSPVMYGNTALFRVAYKLGVCSNHEIKLDSNEENAVYNRYKQLQFCSHFDRSGERTVEVPEKLEFIADVTLRDTIKNDYEKEVIALMLEYSHKYYKNKGLPPIPAQFIDATNKTKLANNEFAKWFYDNYEAINVETAKVSIMELENNAPDNFRNRKEIIKQLVNMKIKWDKDLKGLGKYKDREGIEKEIRGGIQGYRLKTESDGED